MSLSSFEDRMRSAWIRGYASAEWGSMQQEVGSLLIDSHASGGESFGHSRGMVDETAFYERARILTMRGMSTLPAREEVERRHGAWMLGLLLLLFLGREDVPIRRAVRGVPARAVAVARRHGYTVADAARAYAVAREDPAARAVVRGAPTRALAQAEAETRRAWNLGIAASVVAPAAVGATAAAEERADVQVIWTIREVMDARTRGNPSGIYRDDGYHWQVNGYAHTMDEIVRQGLVPPCGVNCRASLRPMSDRTARRIGLLRSDGSVDFAAIRQYNEERQRYIDAGLYPDPGYR